MSTSLASNEAVRETDREAAPFLLSPPARLLRSHPHHLSAMRQFAKNLKDDLKQKATTRKQQRAQATASTTAVATSALRAVSVAAPGLLSPETAPTTDHATKDTCLGILKTGLGILGAVAGDVGVPGLQGAVDALVQVLEAVDVSAHSTPLTDTS